MNNSHGGAGRGQGRPATAQGIRAMAARLNRLADRLAKQGGAAPEVKIALVSLAAALDRITKAAGIAYPESHDDE